MRHVLLMTAIKSHEADAFVARPNPALPVVLVFGEDAGLVHERAEKIVLHSIDDPKDPFALVHIDGDALASEPSRLVEEAHTVPLFGGRRAVWVKPSSRNLAPAVEAVLNAPPTDCRIVVEAGDLRRSSPLRTLCERSRVAAAIPCYADDERALGRLVDDEMRAANLGITPEARAALIALIGGDRQGSRSELRKLALFAHGKDKVDLGDIAAVVADASALELDEMIDAAFAGRTVDAETQFGKAMGAGTSAGTIMFAALRHVTQLHKARVSMDASDRSDDALRAFVPPLHFTRKPRVETALRAWSAPRLERTMTQLADTALAVRRTPALAEALTHRALLQLAVNARRKE